MEKFQENMCNEYHELKYRMGKLAEALSSKEFKVKVGNKQYELLEKQAEAMGKYFHYLSLRLEDMGLLTDPEDYGV